MRLNAIAQVRAQTMAARMSRNFCHPGQPFVSRAATTIEASANGNAKTVWENRTNSAHLRIVENIGSTLTPLHPANVGQVFAERRDDRGPAPLRYPRLPRWIWGWHRTRGWPAKWSHRPATAVQNSSHAPGSVEFHVERESICASPSRPHPQR